MKKYDIHSEESRSFKEAVFQDMTYKEYQDAVPSLVGLAKQKERGKSLFALVKTENKPACFFTLVVIVIVSYVLLGFLKYKTKKFKKKYPEMTL